MQDDGPIRGILLGSMLGLSLWMGAAYSVFFALGFLSHVPTSLWWVLGIFTILTAAEFTLAALRGPAKPSDLSGRP